MPWTDILSPAIVIAVVVLLWRQTNSRLDVLTATVADIDWRLATLEGRIKVDDGRLLPGFHQLAHDRPRRGV